MVILGKVAYEPETSMFPGLLNEAKWRGPEVSIKYEVHGLNRK